MPLSQKKILIIISAWPSKNHPYLTYLFSELVETYPKIKFLQFHKIQIDKSFNFIPLGKINKVLKRTVYKSRLNDKPLQILKKILNILLNWSDALRVYKKCKIEGYSSIQAFGQVYSFNNILGQKFDAVYINALQTARHLCLPALFPNTKIIASSRGQDIEFDPNGYDGILNDLTILHVLGEYLKKLACKRGFPEENIRIISPAALPVQSRSKSNNQQSKDLNQIQIITAARLFWTKGYLYSLRAVQKVIMANPEFNIKYIILGDGEDVEFLKFEAQRLNIQNNVNFLGWQSQDIVNQYMLDSDIYLLLSIEEGFNNSVLQAQNLGLPCIVSDAGGLPENVIHEKSGLVVPRYDTICASEALAILIHNPKKRAQFGHYGRNLVENERSLSLQVLKYAELLNE